MLCVACGRSLHKSLFDSKAHQKLFPKCTLCLGLENEGISRVDFNPYRRLLKDLRESEGGKGAHSSPVFHMEVCIYLFFYFFILPLPDRSHDYEWIHEVPGHESSC